MRKRPADAVSVVNSASLRCAAAYIYASAGEGESTTDLAWDGHTMIWENGVCLAQSQRFSAQQKHCVADVDLDLLCSTRRQTGVFDANRKHHQFSRAGFREIEFILDPATSVRC